MNDMTEILDNAFCHLQNVEIGTKKTKPVKEWFIVNMEQYFSAIKEETNYEVLWIHLYTLQNFCARYLHLNHLYIMDSDIITEDKVQNFEEKSKEYARGLLTTQRHPKVLQAIASFFWIYEEPFVWDIFIEVLKKKRDKLTLSHIGIAIRQCYRLSQEHHRADYISDSQLKELVEVLESKEILPRETELLKSL